MSPDKASVIAGMAATIYAHDKTMGYLEAVCHAQRIYAEAVEQVRASGPTSTEKCTCDYRTNAAPSLVRDCPRHGRG